MYKNAAQAQLDIPPLNLLYKRALKIVHCLNIFFSFWTPLMGPAPQWETSAPRYSGSAPLKNRGSVPSNPLHCKILGTSLFDASLMHTRRLS